MNRAQKLHVYINVLQTADNDIFKDATDFYSIISSFCHAASTLI